MANGGEIELPIRIRSTTAASSKKSPAIELCDVLAGFAAKAAPGSNGGPIDPFIRELVMLGAGQLVPAGGIPHNLYTTGPPKRLAGRDMVSDRRLAEAPFGAT